MSKDGGGKVGEPRLLDVMIMRQLRRSREQAFMLINIISSRLHSYQHGVTLIY